MTETTTPEVEVTAETSSESTPETTVVKEMPREPDPIAVRDNQVRFHCLKTFAKLFDQLTGYVNGLPINTKLKEFGFMNFDQGAMWIRESIASMEIPADAFKDPVPAPEVTPSEPVAEVVNEEVAA